MKIDNELRDIIPPLAEEEKRQLEQNIIKEGWRPNERILTWNDFIIDGHNRYDVCVKNNIEFLTQEMKFDSKDDVKLWMIDNQKGRRNLTDGWKWELAQTKKKLLMEKGKDNLKTNIGDGQRLSIIDKGKEHNTRKDIAEDLGWSSGKVAEADVVWKEAKKEVKEEVKKGIKTIHQVYTEIKKDKKKEERAKKIEEQKKAIAEEKIKPLEGKYQVIVIDPPWKYHDDSVYDAEGFRGVTDYPTMTIEEIQKQFLDNNYADENCVLWLWTTHRFMRHAFTLLDVWGFEEKAILTWCKNKMGIGRWLRSKSEFCIMAVKGKPMINLTNQTTVLNAVNEGHSIKPQEFYDMVDELCVVGRKLDYFARKKRDGWDVYGDEVKDGKAC